jgi:hypothetical protein
MPEILAFVAAMLKPTGPRLDHYRFDLALEE